MKKINCFAPIIRKNSKILFLGSMPSKKSREVNFYYGNKSNRFWTVLSKVYNDDFLTDTETKITLLHKHNIALFDVYKSCEMKKEDSSLDGNIINQTFNDIPSLIKDTEISKIFITSKKAYEDFIREFDDFIKKGKVSVTYLPSPSSANRSVYKTDEELISAWKTILR